MRLLCVCMWWIVSFMGSIKAAKKKTVLMSNIEHEIKNFTSIRLLKMMNYPCIMLHTLAASISCVLCVMFSSCTEKITTCSDCKIHIEFDKLWACQYTLYCSLLNTHIFFSFIHSLVLMIFEARVYVHGVCFFFFYCVCILHSLSLKRICKDSQNFIKITHIHIQTKRIDAKACISATFWRSRF